MQYNAMPCNPTQPICRTNLVALSHGVVIAAVVVRRACCGVLGALPAAVNEGIASGHVATAMVVRAACVAFRLPLACGGGIMFALALAGETLLFSLLLQSLAARIKARRLPHVRQGHVTTRAHGE